MPWPLLGKGGNDGHRQLACEKEALLIGLLGWWWRTSRALSLGQRLVAGNALNACVGMLG